MQSVFLPSIAVRGPLVVLSLKPASSVPVNLPEPSTPPACTWPKEPPRRTLFSRQTYTPSLEDIARETAAIRATWDDNEYLRRAGAPMENVYDGVEDGKSVMHRGVAPYSIPQVRFVKAGAQ